MAKPGFVKVTKIWKKIFSKEEIEEIFQMFKNVADSVKEQEYDWSISSYKDICYGRELTPPIPETDKWDDTEGVQPKQMKRLLKEVPLSVIERLFITFGKQSDSISRMLSSEGENFFDIEDNTISWKKVLKNFILKDNNILFNIGKYQQELYFKRELDKELVEKIALGEISSQTLENVKSVLHSFPYKMDNTFIEGILNGEVLESDISVLKNEQPFDLNVVLSIKNYSPKKFIEKQKTLWGTIHGFIPKDSTVLFLNPKKWDQKVFLSSMELLFQTKQISKLSKEDKEFFIKLYRTFGTTLLDMIPYIKLNKINSIQKYWNLELYDKDIEDKVFKRILSASKKGIDILLNSEKLYYILIALSIIKRGTDNLQKKDRYSIRDLEAIEEAGKLLIQKSGNNEIDIFEDMSFQDFSWLNKANIGAYNMNRLLELYKKTKDLKVKGIPILEGDIGEYHYQLLEKHDIRGLVVGNLSQCCQKIGGIGNDCVYYGAENENSTFFVVTKKGQVVAQSWIWRKKNQITFDSIECVSREHGDMVLDCYEEYSKRALEVDKSIQIITVGSYGRTGANERFPRVNKTYETVNIYSDAKIQYTIKERI